MLYASVQLVEPSVATLAPSATTSLAPDSIPRIAVSDSLTPLAQDSIELFMSCRNPRRSVARSACDGRCTRATATAMARMTAPASQSSRGERRVGQAVRPIGSLGDKLVARTAHRLDQFVAELRPEPPHADVDHVGARLLVAPDRREQPILGHRLVGVLHELPEQQELQPGERDRAMPGVGLHPAHVEAQLSGPEDLVRAIAAQP